jgi:hypothetical protein
MSGECDKCGEHCLDCECSGINFRPPEKLKSFLHGKFNRPGVDDKFFYKGKFFQNEEEFWKFVEDWPFMNTDQETFFREWEHLGKEIWMNIGLRGQEISNACLNEILQENFLHLLQKFFGKHTKFVTPQSGTVTEL